MKLTHTHGPWLKMVKEKILGITFNIRKNFAELARHAIKDCMAKYIAWY